MSSNPRIIINHLHYAISKDKPIFNALSMALGSEKIGLVGRNGIGKSTLLKLIMGEIPPDSGSIKVDGLVGYCPQEINIDLQDTLFSIFKSVAEEWEIQRELTRFGLDYLKPDHSIHSLSGGERTRLFLATAFLSRPDFIILDEPTNNLDSQSRIFLYNAISEWRGGLLVVSHDRGLLNLMDQIIELTSLGVDSYGGNYDYFIKQKALNQAALERQLFDAKKSFNKTKSTVQETQEKREHKKSSGRKLFKTGKIDRLTANAKKGRSEKTQSRNATLHENLLQDAEKKLILAKAKVEILQKINIDMPKTHVPNGKIVLDIKNLTFIYPTATKPIIENFNLSITGPQRIALRGNNGSGKTTLVKLILGELLPLKGQIKLGINEICYLDQQVSLLKADFSLIDNFRQINPTISLKDSYFYLAQFLFRNITAHKKVSVLSGGEKLRAALACALMADNPPKLLILDEPTNHLDLESIENLESALKNYRGAMIVISHDQQFLQNIEIKTVISAPFQI